MATSSSDAIPSLSASDEAAGVPPHTPGPPHEPSAFEDPADVADPLGGSCSGEVVIPPSTGSGSATFALPPGLIDPDPVLGALAQPPPSEDDRDGPGPGPAPSLGSAAPVATSTSSGDPLRALGLDVAKSAPAKPSRARRSGSEDDVEIEYITGPNWPMVLLASYASAVTLALIWWVVLPRLRGNAGPEASPPPPAPATADLEPRRADRSRRVEPARPIPADRMTTVGKPLTIGQLEVTPLGAVQASVRIRRAGLGGRVEVKDGGARAVALRLRLRNTSKDAVFAPLDEAFVRDRDDGVSESFVELDSGERVYLFPLPVESEWSIVGQDFPALKPGEARETQIFTLADFPSTSSGMTWRIKLRTGLEETAVIGVRVLRVDRPPAPAAGSGKPQAEIRKAGDAKRRAGEEDRP